MSAFGFRTSRAVRRKLRPDRPDEGVVLLRCSNGDAQVVADGRRSEPTYEDFVRSKFMEPLFGSPPGWTSPKEIGLAGRDSEVELRQLAT